MSSPIIQQSINDDKKALEVLLSIYKMNKYYGFTDTLYRGVSRSFPLLAKVAVRTDRVPRSTGPSANFIYELYRVHEYPSFPDRSRSIFCTNVWETANEYGENTYRLLIPKNARSIYATEYDSATYFDIGPELLSVDRRPAADMCADALQYGLNSFHKLLSDIISKKLNVQNFTVANLKNEILMFHRQKLENYVSDELTEFINDTRDYLLSVHSYFKSAKKYTGHAREYNDIVAECSHAIYVHASVFDEFDKLIKK